MHKPDPDHLPEEDRFLSDDHSERGREIAKAIEGYHAHVLEHEPSKIQFAIYMTGYEAKVDPVSGKTERHVCTMVGGQEDEVVAALLDLAQTMIQKRPESLPLFMAGIMEIMERLRRDHGEAITDENGKVVGTAMAFGPGVKKPDDGLKKDTKSAGVIADLLRKFTTTPGENDGNGTRH